MTNNDIWVRIPNRGDSELDYLLRNINRAREKRDLFLPKQYNEVYTDSSHVHCEICWQVIANENSKEVATGGFYSNDTWVCSQCFVMFIQPERLLDSINFLERIEKP